MTLLKPEILIAICIKLYNYLLSILQCIKINYSIVEENVRFYFTFYLSKRD